ncbi:MAG TPA: hypothetical protein VHR45_00405 [Thermoanaerobaculia bacterium]|nr:hypothetical protein [Thermoanaerobaculia bacterium]
MSHLPLPPSEKTCQEALAARPASVALPLLLILLLAASPAAGLSRACGERLREAKPRPGEQFGCSVSLQGDTLAVGANLDGLGAAATGSVTPFQRGGAGWVPQAKLAPADLRDGDQFGFATAVGGDILAVGAPFGDSERAPGSGAVYVFHRSGSEWSQEAKLAPAEAATGDRFGLVLALSGDLLAVGAPFSSGAGSLAGAVYLFRRGPSGWSEEAALRAADPAPFAAFGFAVAVDGGTLLAGAPFAGGSISSGGAGAAYIFQRSAGGSWAQQAKLIAAPAAKGDELGAAVAVAGGFAVVGARRGAVNGLPAAGAAYAFDGSSGSWKMTERLVAGDPAAGALFGVSAAMSGAHLLLGARADGEAGSAAGAAYLFARDPSSGRWLPVEKRTPAAPAAGALFGQSIALSGNDIVVGGPRDGAGGVAGAGSVAVCGLPAVNLAISLSDGVDAVLPGQTVVYTLAVSNSGDEAVTGAAVTDFFPPQLINVRWCAPRDGAGCTTPRFGDIQDTIDLAAGARAVYTVRAEVAPGARGVVTDQACIAAPAFGVGSICAADTDRILTADLALTLSGPAAGAAAMGGNLAYSLQVSNLGPAPATQVVVVNPVPPGLRPLPQPLAPSDPRCAVEPGRFSCALGTLQAGRSVSLQLVFRVPVCYQSPNPIVDTATAAAAEADPNPANNSATASTVLVPGGRVPAGGCPADLAIAFIGPSQFDGATVRQTIAVTNSGTAAVAGAQVSSFFSPNLKRVLWCRDVQTVNLAIGASGVEGRLGRLREQGCTPDQPGLLNDVITLPAGATTTYVVELFLPPNFVLPRLICHTARAALPGGEVDPTPLDDTANRLVCVKNQIPCAPPPAGFCPGSAGFVP